MLRIVSRTNQTIVTAASRSYDDPEDCMTFVSSLEPTSLWEHFDTILTIPRGSKNEEQMRRQVLDVAERAGLEHRVDAVGNVVVQKPATPGHEEARTTILQSHLDMVNEKNAHHPHDFTTDPIVPQQDGPYLTADGTTLGSDTGSAWPRCSPSCRRPTSCTARWSSSLPSTRRRPHRRRRAGCVTAGGAAAHQPRLGRGGDPLRGVCRGRRQSADAPGGDGAGRCR